MSGLQAPQVSKNGTNLRSTSTAGLEKWDRPRVYKHRRSRKMGPTSGLQAPQVSKNGTNLGSTGTAGLEKWD
ncbi:hypothetical protein CFIMG_005148RA [Ceratocystis fimbriata CBS 114723]|uniref:Uncharacterized protein n=1 Tax=Ceratocystis fimbriata CBS 114723 TaxID=1035309 RepID=A0A2C5X2S5_9PEZI|nr:hypothetical protein CFIMG_005148RA [Ceratocystis fimbriata CBS 114723]